MSIKNDTSLDNEFKYLSIEQKIVDRSVSDEIRTTLKISTLTCHILSDTKAFLDQKWRNAVEKCREDLSPADYESIEQFDSPERVFDDLRKRELEHKHTWLGRAGASTKYGCYCNHASKNLTFPRTVLGPTTQSLESISTLFMMTMIPYQPNFAILWGLLHLATKVCEVFRDRLEMASS
jgi:hypothetical protein